MAACINDLGQNLDRSWSGRSFRTGESKRFNTLQDYNQYTKALELQGTYCADIEPKYTDGYKPGKQTSHTGFLQFQERDPIAQAKYSAMSPGWEGAESSDAAIAKGVYDLDKAEKNREDLRKKQPVFQLPQAPPETMWNCSIQ